MIYNGTEKADKKEELKLSDLYYNEGEKREPMLELKVIQHNINGYEDGKNKCRQLYEYQWFTETFRRLMEEGYTAEEAVEQTMNEIPEDFTIRELLRLNRDEVIGMWLFEYDEKKHMEMERRDSEAQGFEKGKAEGLAEGKAEGKAELIQRKLDKGKTFEQACEDLELSEAEIEEIRQFFKV
jgi:flagellar biosynthesis/type III secretory pathway protein FliH